LTEVMNCYFSHLFVYARNGPLYSCLSSLITFFFTCPCIQYSLCQSWLVVLRLTSSINLSLDLLSLHVSCGFHSRDFLGNPFPGILFTCQNFPNRF